MSVLCSDEDRLTPCPPSDSPQDPFLYKGSVRRNLDPLEHYTDPELWEALEMVGLKPAITALEQGLDFQVRTASATDSQPPLTNSQAPTNKHLCPQCPGCRQWCQFLARAAATLLPGPCDAPQVPHSDAGRGDRQR